MRRLRDERRVHEDRVRSHAVVHLEDIEIGDGLTGRRVRLLQSVAKATAYLLANVGYDAAINEALATLGTAAQVDRICISMNHAHPGTEEIATSMRFEWTRETVPPVLRNAHRQRETQHYRVLIVNGNAQQAETGTEEHSGNRD